MTARRAVPKLPRAMPIYEYACAACGHQFEEWQKMSDKPVRICPKCKAKKVEKLISQTSFKLKGGGWYSDLYAGPKPNGAKDHGVVEGLDHVKRRRPLPPRPPSRPKTPRSRRPPPDGWRSRHSVIERRTDNEDPTALRPHPRQAPRGTEQDRRRALHPRHRQGEAASRRWSSPSATARSSRTAALRKLEVKAGDKILFAKYSGTEIKIDGTEHLILREDDILAVLD